MWKRGLGQWSISGEFGGVEVEQPVFAGGFLRYPVQWGGTLALGHLFRWPVARWSGRVTSGGEETGSGDAEPNPDLPPEPDPLLSKLGPDV